MVGGVCRGGRRVCGSGGGGVCEGRGGECGRGRCMWGKVAVSFPPIPPVLALYFF